MDEPEFCPPTASNYVCTAHINARVDNAKLAFILSGRYAPKIFPCCTVTGLFPRLTYQIFEQENAKIVISGASSTLEALFGLHLLVLNLSRSLKRTVRIFKFRVENIVAFGGFGFWFDQSRFFQDYQMSSRPPKSMANAGLLQPERKEQTSNRKRKRMRGACYCEFKPLRFKGLQFFIKYPIVIILYDTGKYVVTGSNNKADILLAINAVNWSKYKLAKGDTIEKMRARIKKLSAISKWQPYGHVTFNNPHKRFCNVFTRAFYTATNQKSKRFTFTHPLAAAAAAEKQSLPQQTSGRGLPRHPLPAATRDDRE
jgi:TATA-box binding protein (TBP) (component of TFIID and TFIIIB)